MREITSVRGLASTEGVIVAWRVAMATRRVEGYMVCCTGVLTAQGRDREGGEVG